MQTTNYFLLFSAVIFLANNCYGSHDRIKRQGDNKPKVKDLVDPIIAMHDEVILKDTGLFLH